jgi:hypothetical protein
MRYLRIISLFYIIFTFINYDKKTFEKFFENILFYALTDLVLIEYNLYVFDTV